MAFLATLFCVFGLVLADDDRRSARAGNVSAYIGVGCYCVILLMYQIIAFVI